jgi:hypothetical protein
MNKINSAFVVSKEPVLSQDKRGVFPWNWKGEGCDRHGKPS